MNAPQGHGANIQIPGILTLSSHKTVPTGLILLAGPAGVGKTMYCRQFIVEGLKNGDPCLFVSSTLTEKNANAMFSEVDSRLKGKLKIISLHDLPQSKRDARIKLSNALVEIRSSIMSMAARRREPQIQRNSIRIVVDCLSHLAILCGNNALNKFVWGLSAFLEKMIAVAICTINTGGRNLQNSLSSFSAGIIEMKFEEAGQGSAKRMIRLLSLKGVHQEPRWTQFTISNSGELAFLGQSASDKRLHCTLCGKMIMREPILESDFVFDTQDCAETYRRLASTYGTSISDVGLPSKAFDASFFFIDIVGLSDPTLSVEKQRNKIEVLNKLIASCDIFTSAKYERIVLPSGDGLAVGFLVSPTSPLELSIELHKKLQSHNRASSLDDSLNVRIGLASGPVFTVTDMNNIQNVWGPGIILAKRVMDVGDDGHILLADKLAEELIALKDDYRRVIKSIYTKLEIKHGQKIGLYSAYSSDFGNPELPKKLHRAS